MAVTAPGASSTAVGLVSAVIAEAALEAGAAILTGAPVALIEPGKGVELESGHALSARAVVSNADPRRTLDLVADPPAGFAARVGEWPLTGASGKVTLALSRLAPLPHEVGWDAMVNIGAEVEGLHRTALAARKGRIGDHLWAEL